MKKCPNCGWEMQYDWDADIYLCGNCNTTITPLPRIVREEVDQYESNQGFPS